jgi:hypothetical protein
MFSSHIIIAQSDYNKVDEKGKKWGVWYVDSKRPRYEGLSIMEKK